MIARSQPPASRKDKFGGVRHGAGVERRDLVAVLVGAAEERRRELVADLLARATCRCPRRRATAGSRRSPARPFPSGPAARRAAPACRRCSARTRRAACPSSRRGSSGSPAAGGRAAGARVKLPGKRHQVVVGDRSGDDDSHDMGRYLPMMGARACLDGGRHVLGPGDDGVLQRAAARAPARGRHPRRPPRR